MTNQILKTIGIQTIANGKSRSLNSVIEELASKWDGLSSEQRNIVAQTIAS